MHIRSVSFSACGLHAPYLTAAAVALLDNGVYCEFVYCCSGGVFAALYYLLNWRRFGLYREQALDMIPRGRKAREPSACTWLADCCKGICGKRPVESGVGTDLARQTALELVADYLTQEGPDAYKKCNGRLHIQVTRITNCCGGQIGEVHNQWTSNEDLMQCVRCTTDIPGRAGAFAAGERWRGQRYVDGGVLVLHPIRDRATVCITTSAFALRPDQPAYIIKSRPPDGPVIGEIGRDIEEGSTKVIAIEFYRKLWDDGYADCEDYIDRRKRHFDTREAGAHSNEEFNPTDAEDAAAADRTAATLVVA